MHKTTAPPAIHPLPTQADLDNFSDEVQDVWFLLVDIKDPEFPCSLAELRVIRPENFRADEFSVSVVFVPTIPHCSLSNFIGLALKEKLRRHFGDCRKIFVAVKEHEDAEKLNKQLADKERTQAAMENPEIADIVLRMIGD